MRAASKKNRSNLAAIRGKQNTNRFLQNSSSPFVSFVGKTK